MVKIYLVSFLIIVVGFLIASKSLDVTIPLVHEADITVSKQKAYNYVIVPEDYSKPNPFA